MSTILDDDAGALKAELLGFLELGVEEEECDLPLEDREYERWLIAEGLWFFPGQVARPRGCGIDKKPTGWCWKYSAKTAMTFPHLTYTEGIAVQRMSDFIYHGWCIDDRGNVIDPTWRMPGDLYFGVPLATETLALFLRSDVCGPFGPYPPMSDIPWWR